MKQDELMSQWLIKMRRAQKGHFEAASHLEQRNYQLGVPVIVLTTIVGSSVFVGLQQATSLIVQIAIGAASITAAVLASLQTFLRFTERAERHRVAGVQYGALRGEIEVLETLPSENSQVRTEALRSLQERWNNLSAESPTIPARVWSRVDEEIKATKRNDTP